MYKELTDKLMDCLKELKLAEKKVNETSQNFFDSISFQNFARKYGIQLEKFSTDNVNDPDIKELSETDEGKNLIEMVRNMIEANDALGVTIEGMCRYKIYKELEGETIFMAISILQESLKNNFNNDLEIDMSSKFSKVICLKERHFKKIIMDTLNDKVSDDGEVKTLN